MITYYISGPMTGIAEHNHPQFLAVEKALAEAEWATPPGRIGGFEIINPARNFGGDTTRELTEYMTKDLAQVISSDVIVLLPAWETSVGARREADVATWTGKKFMLACPSPRYAEGEAWSFVPLDGPPAQTQETQAESSVRTFATGATRDTETGKFDYEAFLSPAVLLRYAQYMHKHRTRSDGTLRDGDDWQKGIPRDVYMKSMWRHFLDAWLLHRGYASVTGAPIDEALCALLFNVMGYLHEVET